MKRVVLAAFLVATVIFATVFAFSVYEKKESAFPIEFGENKFFEAISQEKVFSFAVEF